MSNLKTLKIGTEFILEATSFTQQKNIERSAPSIQWTITPKGGSPEVIGTGKAINYKITDKYAGKEVVFRAFIKEDSYKMYPQQCLTCFIEKKVSTEGILIKEVSKSGSIKIGGVIECKVTLYNKPSNQITEAQKCSIKWDIKVGDREKKVFTTDKNEPYRGETIKFIVPKSWSGENVILMPYLNQSTEKVSTNLSVETSIKDTQKCGCICEERVRAFMRMLRVGEGTVGEEGYEKLFGGESFIKDYKKGWSKHPQILISKSGFKSTAAGAYQIMGYTYKELNGWSKNSSSNLYDKYTESKDYLKKHKITDFSPLSQDLICLVILRYKRNGILKLITGGNVKEALEKYGSYEWASLPPGRYGQPAKTMDEALALYDKYYKEELSVKSDLHLKQGFLKDFYSECCCQYNQVCSIVSKYDIDKAVTKLIFNKKTNSQGLCAKYVRIAIEAGGLSTEKRPNSAKDYDKFLPTIGFSTVATEEYTPQKGDIVVIQNIDNHPHGHIAMYDGEHWISDFEQRDFWGGQSYRTIKPKHTFFRWKQ